MLYRRKHKKGQEEDVSKKRNKRTQKFQRAVVGATLQVMLWCLSYGGFYILSFSRISWPRETRSPRSGRLRGSRP